LKEEAKSKSEKHRCQRCREPEAQPAGRKVLLVKPPHSSLPKPIANGAEITPANPLFSVQTSDKLGANSLLNQTCCDQSRGENHYADKLGWMHKAILIGNSGVGT